MKCCAKCKEEKDLSEFYERSDKPGKYHSYCKQCSKIRHSEYYLQRKTYYREKRLRHVENLKKQIAELKDVPCMDCGNSYPTYVMEFDHRDRETKVGDVSRMAHEGFRSKVLEEVKKCDVVCANCHRVRTYGG